MNAVPYQLEIMYNINLNEITQKIPASCREEVIEKVADMLLTSPKMREVPNEFVRKIGYYWMQGQLTTDVGLKMLLETATSIEPEKTLVLLNGSE
ncbi:MAG: hypothetical protein ABIH76_07565 [Candidatus Bathyarchaeota archaeon]